MSEHRCLKAVADRRPMSTTIFDLRRAERAGYVTMKAIGSVTHWSLTASGAERLRGHDATASRETEAQRADERHAALKPSWRDLGGAA